MAGARDLKRETTRIRREQAERNQRALEAREARITAAEETLKLRPSERRRAANRARRERSERFRSGHRVAWFDPDEEEATEEGQHETQGDLLEEKMETTGAPSNKMLADSVPENKAEHGHDTGGAADDDGVQADPLARIAFASSEARNLARSAGLSAEELASVEPSGVTGLTVGDVRTLVEA